MKPPINHSIDKSNDSCQIFDELENVVKNTPSPSRQPRMNPSILASHTDKLKEEKIPMRETITPSRMTLNVQSKSPNIKQVNVQESVDEVLDESSNSPISYTQDMSETPKINTKSVSRYESPLNENDEEIDMFDKVAVHNFDQKNAEEIALPESPKAKNPKVDSYDIHNSADRLSEPRQEYLPMCTQEMIYNMTKCVGAQKYFPQLPDPPKEIDQPSPITSPILFPENNSLKVDLPISTSPPKGKEKKRTLTVPEELKVKPEEPGRAKTLMPLPVLEYHKRLFEEFFVVGCDQESVENVKMKDFAFVKPTKLFQYPNLPEDKDW